MEISPLVVSLNVNYLEPYFYNGVVAIVILLGGLVLGIIAKKLLYRSLKELGTNWIATKVGMSLNLESALSSLLSYLIYFVTIILFLDQLGIRSIVVYIIVGVVLMLIILSFMVGIKDVLPNLYGGVILKKAGKIKEGRNVIVQEVSGRVEKIGFLETKIKTKQGDILHVPNSLFSK
ncbi:mechanosensitive ion channel [Candidatus Woesearchaeota archaeon]|nr:mechanosensitive ion channel [Candidatus Woesearchaeota archaeon]